MEKKYIPSVVLVERNVPTSHVMEAALYERMMYLDRASETAIDLWKVIAVEYIGKLTGVDLRVVELQFDKLMSSVLSSTDSLEMNVIGRPEALKEQARHADELFNRTWDFINDSLGNVMLKTHRAAIEIEINPPKDFSEEMNTLLVAKMINNLERRVYAGYIRAMFLYRAEPCAPKIAEEIEKLSTLTANILSDLYPMCGAGSDIVDTVVSINAVFGEHGLIKYLDYLRYLQFMREDATLVAG